MSMSDISVSAPAGTFCGVSDAGVNKYLGIRYARPPTGALRFRAPQAMPIADSPVDATEYGDRNFEVGQPDMFTEHFEMPGGESEDCLYLNVFAPRDTSSPVPVLVWIHGGAFIGGSGNQYNPTNLVAQNDVIVVTINYRLGIFGFLNLAPLGEEFAGSANLGLQDQVMALKWVNDNIAAFGGDASNITIFGESAGAASVLAHLSSPMSQGLFHRAMAFSGSETIAPPMEHLELLKAIFQVDTAEACLDRLMAMSGEELTQFQQDCRLYHGPGIDGVVLTQTACDAIAGGLASDIPILIGNTKDEGTMLAPGYTEVAEEAVGLQYALGMTICRDDGSSYAAYLDGLYASDDLLSRVTRAWTDTFRSGALRVAQCATAHGAGGWVYNFDVETDDPLGVTHGSDVPFMFYMTDDSGQPRFLWHESNAINTALAKQWSQTIVAFAKTGVPSGAGLPEWPQYDQSERRCLRISQQSAVVANPDGDAMLELYNLK